MTTLLLLASALFTCIGDYLAKKWSMSPSVASYLLAVAVYALGAALFVPTLRYKQLVVANMIWTCATVFGFLLIGIVLFGERPTSVQQLGLAFGVVSLVLLSVG